MPRSELGAHRSRASGSSNDERMSSLLRQHYLLRVLNSCNKSRERFVTHVTAKVFRSLLAPRDGETLLYTICVLGACCIPNSAVLPLKNETGTSVLQGVVTCWVCHITVLFVGFFPRKCTDSLLLCHIYAVALSSLCMESTSYDIFPFWMVFFLLCFK